MRCDRGQEESGHEEPERKEAVRRDSKECDEPYHQQFESGFRR